MAGATDVERLAVLIEANTKSYENAMKKLIQQTDSAAGRMERRFKDAGKRLENTFHGLGATLSRGLGALGIGLSTRELVRYADAYTGIQNALKVTGLEGDRLNAVYGRLYESAQRNAVPIASLAALYGRVSLVSGELGVSQEQLIGFSDRIALALRVSGQSAESASGALTQLSQALGSGVVRAEEFNSILEGAPTIVQSVARGITEAGGSVAKLRQLVVDGKVSSKAFFDAYMIGSGDLERSAAKMDGTVAQAMTRLNNAFTNAVGEINKVTGTSKTAETAIDELAKALKWIADNVSTIKGPYDEIAKAIRGVGNEASTAAQWMARIRQYSPAGIGGNIASYAADKMGIGGTKPAADVYPDEGGRGLAAARFPVAAISINDPKYQAPGKEKKDNSVGVDSFERAMAQAQKRIEIQKAENATIAQGTAARERAKLVAELETAAKAANAAQGLINNEVTADQNLKIQETADKMYAVAAAAEAANEPLARAALTATDMSERFQDLAVSSIDGLSSSLADIVTGAKTAEEAFKDFAQSVVRELTAMIIKALIFKAIKLALGIPFADGGSVGFADGGSVKAFAGGGTVHGRGTGRSDSIPAWLSNGEYVVNAEAARQHRDLLDAINFGVPRFADGGPVQGRGMDGNAGRAYGGTQPGARGSNVSTVRFDMRGIRKADFFTGGDLEMFADRLAGLINDGGAGRLKVELLRAT